MHRVAIVGGCAGGLELATQPGETLDFRQMAPDTLARMIKRRTELRVKLH